MKISRDPKSKRYRARVRAQNGEHVRIPLKTKSKREAERLAKAAKIEELETAARLNVLTRETVARITAGRKVTTEQAIEAWGRWLPVIGRAARTVSGSLQDVRGFARACDILNKPPSVVDERMVNKWINNPEMKARLNYRRVLLSRVSSFFQYCAKNGWSLGDPTMLVKVNLSVLTHEQKEPREVQTFTASEIAKIVNDKETHEFWRFATLFSWETSIRLSDICQLEWACFEKPGKAIVWTDKRDKRVAVPISKTLQNMIADIPVMSARYLFPEQRTLALDNDRRALLSVQFRRVCERLGINGKTFHSIRHTTITRWWKDGKTLEDIGELVGHSDTKTTRRYVHA